MKITAIILLIIGLLITTPVINPMIAKEEQTQLVPALKFISQFCGCDEKTYPNDCYAQRAGVKKWTEGECATRR